MRVLFVATTLCLLITFGGAFKFPKVPDLKLPQNFKLPEDLRLPEDFKLPAVNVPEFIEKLVEERHNTQRQVSSEWSTEISQFRII